VEFVSEADLHKGLNKIRARSRALAVDVIRHGAGLRRQVKIMPECVAGLTFGKSGPWQRRLVTHACARAKVTWTGI